MDRSATPPLRLGRHRARAGAAGAPGGHAVHARVPPSALPGVGLVAAPHRRDAPAPIRRWVRRAATRRSGRRGTGDEANPAAHAAPPVAASHAPCRTAGGVELFGPAQKPSGAGHTASDAPSPARCAIVARIAGGG